MNKTQLKLVVQNAYAFYNSLLYFKYWLGHNAVGSEFWAESCPNFRNKKVAKHNWFAGGIIYCTYNGHLSTENKRNEIEYTGKPL